MNFKSNSTLKNQFLKWVCIHFIYYKLILSIMRLATLSIQYYLDHNIYLITNW